MWIKYKFKVSESVSSKIIFHILTMYAWRQIEFIMLYYYRVFVFVLYTGIFFYFLSLIIKLSQEIYRYNKIITYQIREKSCIGG